MEPAEPIISYQIQDYYDLKGQISNYDKLYQFPPIERLFSQTSVDDIKKAYEDLRAAIASEAVRFGVDPYSPNFVQEFVAKAKEQSHRSCRAVLGVLFNHFSVAAPLMSTSEELLMAGHHLEMKYDLKKVTTLDLSRRQLTTLPRGISLCVNLERLNLSHNDLRYLPGELSKLTKLTSVTLVGNEIQELPKGLGQIKNLTLFVNLATYNRTIHEIATWTISKVVVV